MNKKMRSYYISRGVLSLIFGLVIYLLTHSIWISILFIMLNIAVFTYLPHSGRYKVKPEGGVTPLRRDEWTQIITDKAGRNAWVVVALMGSFTILYFGLISPGDVPVTVLAVIIFSGNVAYYGTDFWFRRS